MGSISLLNPSTMRDKSLSPKSHLYCEPPTRASHQDIQAMSWSDAEKL